MFELHRCISTPSDSPMRPSNWLFRVATTLLHISRINIAWCTVWLEKTRLHCCFLRIQRVIGLTNSSTTWALALIRVEQILSMVENKVSCALSPTSSPLPDVRTCQLGNAMITNRHSPTFLDRLQCFPMKNPYLIQLIDRIHLRYMDFTLCIDWARQVRI